MWLCAGQARAQFALFSGLRAASRATNGHGRFPFGLHGLHNEPLLADKMVNSDQFAIAQLVNTSSREIPTSAGVVLWVRLIIGLYFINRPFSSESGTQCRYRTHCYHAFF